MDNKGIATAGSVLRLVGGGLLCAGMIAGSANLAAAQEIQPYEFTPLPSGSNLAIGYYVYGHNTEFNVSGGPTFKNSKLEANLGVGRYVHYIDVAGHPAGFQLIQIFGSLSGANVGGQSLGSAFGAQNLALSAFIWPYVNTATKTNFNTTVYIYPPTGTYDPRAPLNVGDNRWRGDIQLGLTQGLGERIAFDASFDVQLYGDNDNAFPRGSRISQDPTYRLQFWANYRWTPAFTTAIGYEGFFGGDQQENGFRTGNKTDEHRIRANAALFITPKLQTMVELNHDVAYSGGFKQDFGAQLRVLYAF